MDATKQNGVYAKNHTYTPIFLTLDESFNDLFEQQLKKLAEVKDNVKVTISPLDRNASDDRKKKKKRRQLGSSSKIIEQYKENYTSSQDLF